MLKDKVRTSTYHRAIMQNAHLLKDKVVLDVGCGTGILSLFVAQAGAKLVIAIDASEILESAREIVKANGYEDKITLIRGVVEEVDIPVEKVDVIISEWMGYFLFYESMLNTIIYARDKWLTDGGLIFPNKANLYLTAIEDYEYMNERMHFWDRVYGFDMSCIKEHAYREPLIDTVNSDTIVTSSVSLKSIDLHKVKLEDLSWETDFELYATRNDYIHALVAYFDVEFSDGHKTICFTTSPYATYTHWKQTVFYLKETLTINADEIVRGKFKVSPNKTNHREIDIELEYQFSNAHYKIGASQSYRLR